MAKHKPKYDWGGQVVVMGMGMLKSEQYLSLSSQAKSLMALMQVHWQEFKLVDYGIREAEKKIPCSNKTAIKAFKELEDKGFITCLRDHYFSSRTESRTRAWRLEWMPYNSQRPTHKWKKQGGN